MTIPPIRAGAAKTKIHGTALIFKALRSAGLMTGSREDSAGVMGLGVGSATGLVMVSRLKGEVL